MAEWTELERRVALAIAKLASDDPRAEWRAGFLQEHARAAIAEVLRWQAENDADAAAPSS